ncbi:MAG TPA: amidohydrolase family protein, partial [Pirellulales bacterium]|nr:amidohydrolase family protein [Pirellulales bacterium]
MTEPSGVSRREALKTAALAASALTTTIGAGASAADEQSRSKQSRTSKATADAKLADPKTGAIDAHVHVWTPDTKGYPLAAGFRRDQMLPPSFTPEELFDHARPCGVARIVLIQMSFYGFDNAYMLDSIERFPGVFSGVAVIDDGVEAPQAEMR